MRRKTWRKWFDRWAVPAMSVSGGLYFVIARGSLVLLVVGLTNAVVWLARH